MKRPVVPAGMRHILTHYVKRLYLDAGHKLEPKGNRVRAMASVVAGRRLTQREAWKWLYDRYEPGDKSLPSIPRSKKARVPHPPLARVSFYETDEWRAVRFEALKASDGCCTLCGRSKRNHGVVLHVDHIKPRSRFPELALSAANLQVLCEDCNLGKSNRDTTDWRPANEQAA